MAARITIAAPRASMAELRAVACCLEHCPDAPRRPMTPKRCCFVDSPATDPATTVTVSLAKDSGLVAAAILPALVPTLTASGEPHVNLAAVSRAGPPLFVRIRSLRI